MDPDSTLNSPRRPFLLLTRYPIPTWPPRPNPRDHPLLHHTVHPSLHVRKQSVNGGTPRHDSDSIVVKGLVWSWRTIFPYLHKTQTEGGHHTGTRQSKGPGQRPMSRSTRDPRTVRSEKVNGPGTQRVDRHTPLPTNLQIRGKIETMIQSDTLHV